MADSNFDSLNQRTDSVGVANKHGGQ